MRDIENNKFYKLVSDYQRAETAVASCAAQVNMDEQEAARLAAAVWNIQACEERQELTCGSHNRKMQMTIRYEKAIFQSNAATRLTDSLLKLRTTATEVSVIQMSLGY